MDSTTSRARDASDEHDDEREELTELLEHLAAAPPSDRALGSAVLLRTSPLPTRANLGNPPRSAQKNAGHAQIGPERTGS